MLQAIHEQISVITVFNHLTRKVSPYKIHWNGRNYLVKKLGYYHKRKVGKNILHIFDVTDGKMAFRVVCNSENLHWSIEEVSDGAPF